MLAVNNHLSKSIWIEIYHYEEDAVKCEFLNVDEKGEIAVSDIYKIVVFYERRFHEIPSELLNKKIRRVEFPFFMVNLEYAKDTIQLTLLNYEV